MFDRGVRRMGAAIALSLALVFTVGGMAFAQRDGDRRGTEGCTLGFWKNHLDDWGPTGFSPAQSLTGAGFVIPAGITVPGATPLLQALEFPGGPGLDGAARILLRQAVAAALNAAHPAVSYPIEPVATVIGMTNAALLTLDRGVMLFQASQFDAFNNLGCPHPFPVRR